MLLVNRAGTTSQVGQVSICLPFRPSSVRLIFFQSDIVGFLCFAMQTAWPKLSWDLTTMCLNILYESMWCSQHLFHVSCDGYLKPHTATIFWCGRREEGGGGKREEEGRVRRGGGEQFTRWPHMMSSCWQQTCSQILPNPRPSSFSPSPFPSSLTPSLPYLR